MEKNFESFIQAWQDHKQSGKPFVTVTLVNSRGSAPQDQGARMITDGKSVLFGTIGGGKVEALAIKEAAKLIQDKEKKTHHVLWNLQKDVGMTCGGEVSLFFESEGDNEKNWNISIYGAGHVSQELCRVLERLDCSITCIDQRQEWLSKLPKTINTLQLDSPKDYVKEMDDHSFAILMTMGHATDAPILEEILKSKNLPYVGVIGSESKSRLLKNEMEKAGISKEKIESFICPIGESFGDNSPAEIALSIAAQLLKVKDEVFKTVKRKK